MSKDRQLKTILILILLVLLFPQLPAMYDFAVGFQQGWAEGQAHPEGSRANAATRLTDSPALGQVISDRVNAALVATTRWIEAQNWSGYGAAVGGVLLFLWNWGTLALVIAIPIFVAYKLLRRRRRRHLLAQ